MMRPHRILVPAVAVGTEAALRSPDFRVRLGERLAIARPEPAEASRLGVCAVCGDLRDPSVGFCSGCGSHERVQVDEPDDPRIRLVSRVVQTLADEAALYVRSDSETSGGAALHRSRAVYGRLGAQRRLLRDRLLHARTAEERELYQHVLQRVERVLRRGAG